MSDQTITSLIEKLEGAEGEDLAMQAADRLEEYLKGNLQYRAYRGEAPAGEPTLRRDLAVALAWFRSQPRAQSEARV